MKEIVEIEFNKKKKIKIMVQLSVKVEEKLLEMKNLKESYWIFFVKVGLN